MKALYRNVVHKLEELKASTIKLCIEGRFSEDSVFVLTSTPRSGSTWLGNALSAIPNSCVLFEPLHLRHVPEAKAAGFSWRTYARPEQHWPEGEAFLRRVFEGRTINRWTSREMDILSACRSKAMIVKFVRANRLLPWICKKFDIRSPVVLIRHPCAVIASQMKATSWRNIDRPKTPSYVKGYPLFESVLSETSGLEEYLAASWALDLFPLLIEDSPRPWLIITYEDLFFHPEIPLTNIFKAWNLKVDLEEAVSRLNKPSSVVSKSGISGIDGWKKQLTKKQITRILRTTEKFGLHFYSEEIEPNNDFLHSEQLPKHIQKMGQVSRERM